MFNKKQDFIENLNVLVKRKESMGIFGNKNASGDSASSSLNSSRGKSKMMFWISTVIALVCISVGSYYFYRKWRRNKEIEAINQGL